MAGILLNLPLSQQFDNNGDPYIGALLYVYAANTSTPSQTFADFGLTTLNPFPMTTDASGRVPVFWVADGLYRARLTDAGGVEIFDIAVIQSIGPSTGGGGGGGGGSVDATTVFQTGDFLWIPISGLRTGWVRGNGRTISSALGAGTERADADTQPLFEYSWNAYDNTLCPVLPGGRGATALIDYNAGKTLGLLDMRGYGPFGLDNMGSGSAAGRVVAGTPDTYGTSGGAETVPIIQANLPALTWPKTLGVNKGTMDITASGGNNRTNFLRGGSIAAADGTLGGGSTPKNQVQVDLSLTGQPALTGDTTSGGSDVALNKMPPYRLGSWFIKL